MPAPINYSGGEVVSPSAAFGSAFKDAAGLQQIRLQQQQQQLANQQALDLRTDLAAYQKNPTIEGISTLSMKYPQLSENFKRVYDMKTADQQKADLDLYTPVYAAALNNKPEVAAELLTNYATALENSGDEKKSKLFKSYAQLAKDHPEQAKTTLGLLLSSVMGDKFGTTFGQLGDESRKAALAPAELKVKEAEALIKQEELAALPGMNALKVKDLQSQIDDRTKRFALDKDKFTSETQLKVQEFLQKFGEVPEFAIKEINQAAGDSIAAKQSAEKMTDLANRLEAEGGGYGGLSTATEWIKKATGNQNEMTRLRSEYSRIVTPAAMGAYKKVAAGSTSDRDIETAMKGVPPDTADAATMASFLRGAAKLQQYDAVFNNIKGEWLGANKGNLGKAKTDIEIDGVQVPAGRTFNEFSTEFLTKKIGELATMQETQQLEEKLKGRSYLKYGKDKPITPLVPK